MNPVSMHDPVAGTSVPVEPASVKDSLAQRMRGVRQVCRQVFGIPDYERYLAHAAEHHPGAAVLSRREYCARAIEHKYGRNGPRCC